MVSSGTSGVLEQQEMTAVLDISVQRHRPAADPAKARPR